MKKEIFTLFFVLITMSGCQEIKLEEETEDNYSVSLGEFSTFEETDIFKTKVDFQLWRELRIKKVGEKRYLLLFGNFLSSFDAGGKAFELFTNSIINNYKIFYKDDYCNDNFGNILFVAKYQGRLSVYTFNLLTKKAKLEWSRWGRKVLALNHSTDRSTAFITTALGYGQQGSFPYVRDPRLYIYSSNTGQVDEIEELGSGLQLYTYWETEDTFKINLTKPGSINSEQLIQEILSYDAKGNKGIKKFRKFSLLKDGFPKPPIAKPTLISPNGIYYLKVVKEGKKNYLYLRDSRIRSEKLMGIIEGENKAVYWTADCRFAFIIFDKKTAKQKQVSRLIIINTNEEKINRNFIDTHFQNILVQGSLLFFDEQHNGNSLINIYDFNKDTIYYKIQMLGGCGINNLLN